jgi:hypothetical protein
MKKIPLTQEYFALVDDEDFKRINQHKWYAHKTGEYWYAHRNSSSKNGVRYTITMHQEILGLEYGNETEIDHRNGNGLDNQKENIRICNRSENMRNRKIQIHSSKYKGVCFCKDKNKWQSYICHNLNQIYLGRFGSEIEAARAYNVAARKYFGEFAKLNIA